MSRITSDVGPWSLIPAWVNDAGVSDRAVRLFAVLGFYADKEGACHPARSTLASRLGCTVDSIDRAKRELRDIGALEWAQHPDGLGGLTSNDYRLVYAAPPGVAAVLRPPSRGGAATPRRGPAATPSRGDAAENQNQLELDPSTKGSAAVPASPPSPVMQLVAGYVEDVRKAENGHEPQRRWKATAGRAVRTALDEGEPERAIAVCLGICAAEGKNPASLPHVLSDYHAKRPRRNQR